MNAKPTILVIEDDDKLQKAYQQFLGMKYNVASCYNGNDVIPKLREHKPQLVIMDLGIPEIDGRSLIFGIKKINKDLPIIKEAINIVRQIALGMAEAHKHDIIHRDLKPSNILYNREQQHVKIVDFGLARRIQGEQHEVTQVGMAIGTPYYMSPEQCCGHELNELSDIYNLGATFFHLVVGRPPFVRKDVMQILFAHTNDNLSWKDTQIPLSLRIVLEKMMAKHPEDRYQTMQEVADELQ